MELSGVLIFTKHDVVLIVVIKNWTIEAADGALSLVLIVEKYEQAIIYELKRLILHKYTVCVLTFSWNKHNLLEEDSEFSIDAAVESFLKLFGLFCYSICLNMYSTICKSCK